MKPIRNPQSALSEAVRRTWRDPEVRARRKAGIRAGMANRQRRPKALAITRERNRSVARRTWDDPQVRARRRAAFVAAWADPEKRERRLAAQRRAWLAKHGVCRPCHGGRHLLCDGEGCACLCAAELDIILH